MGWCSNLCGSASNKRDPRAAEEAELQQLEQNRQRVQNQQHVQVAERKKKQVSIGEIDVTETGKEVAKQNLTTPSSSAMNISISDAETSTPTPEK